MDSNKMGMMISRYHESTHCSVLFRLCGPRIQFYWGICSASNIRLTLSS